ncbi:hypothetical protein CCACVL1_18525 [Corchorus capsularis]|uniref:Uncharacterized protein n=1 Tax=Corchorus capsularis TaxID=210143 RepID=A0A1R3HKT1_COCAP|nr:hypothetical protein CCACVL1_18525 [Corchorus capsularis]
MSSSTPDVTSTPHQPGIGSSTNQDQATEETNPANTDPVAEGLNEERVPENKRAKTSTVWSEFKDVTSNVAYYETAREIWVDLEERFSQGNAPQVQQLKRELALTDQGKDSVAVYYTKLKSLWDELQLYEPNLQNRIETLVVASTLSVQTTMNRRDALKNFNQVFIRARDDDEVDNMYNASLYALSAAGVVRELVYIGGRFLLRNHSSAAPAGAAPPQALGNESLINEPVEQLGLSAHQTSPINSFTLASSSGAGEDGSNHNEGTRDLGYPLNLIHYRSSNSK